MSEEQGSVVQNETEVEKKERRAAVGEKKFLEAYIPMAKAGKTRREIAEKLGMEIGSFRQREQAIRKYWKENGVKLPEPTSEQGHGDGRGRVSFEEMQDLLKENGFTA